MRTLRTKSALVAVAALAIGFIPSMSATAEDTEAICDAADLITNATSLGGVETTWERRRRWALESASVPENLIRISVGCEAIDDIWNDINGSIERTLGK